MITVEIHDLMIKGLRQTTDPGRNRGGYVEIHDLMIKGLRLCELARRVNDQTL